MSVQAQRGFHRAYKSASPDSINFVTDAIATPSGEYQILAQDRIGEVGYSVNLMRLDVKGSELYSRRVFLADSTRIKNTNEIIRLDNGVGVFSATLDDDDKTGSIVAFDERNGVPLWSQRFGGDEEGNIQLASVQNGKFVMASIIDGEGSGYALSMLNAEGELIWTNTLKESQLNLSVVTDIHYSQVDSSIYLTGVVEGNNRYYISKLDTLGSQVWARSYNVETGIYPSQLLVSPDSLIFLSGTYSNTGMSPEQILVRHDYEGNVDWAKVAQGTISISSGMVERNNNLVLGIKRYDNINDLNANNHPAIVEIDTAGNIVKSQQFPRSKHFPPASPINTLMKNAMNGVALVTTERLENSYTCPTLISTDANLEIPCGSNLDISFTDITIAPMELAFTKSEGITLDTMETDLSGLSMAFPTIAPEVEEWCPNEPILDTLDARPSNIKLDAIISYEWSTGSTDSIIVAMEEGEFMVTVTIDGHHCYQLCDTVQITRLPLPEVGIEVVGDLCNTNPITLNALATGAQPISTFEWSNGLTTPTIQVSEFGTYSVEVTDNCQEKASASVSIVQPELAFTINVPQVEDCSEIQIAPIVTSPPNLIDQAMIDWQWTNPDGTTSTESVISNPSPGDYTLQGMYCGSTVTATANVPSQGMLTWPKVFFPNGQEELNKTFGPLNPCNLDITNYELKVFNRWGQEVFTSDNINFEWDGRYNDAEGGTAVYVWYATYSIGDASPVTDKGDVTLIRG